MNLRLVEKQSFSVIGKVEQGLLMKTICHLTNNEFKIDGEN